MSADRLQGAELDAAFHLLDRQVVDKEGLLVCKVDDLELSFPSGGRSPAVTRVLTGPAALLPRFSGRNGHWIRRRWKSLGIQYADRDVPLSFPLTAIERLGSAVELNVDREGLLDRQPPAGPGVEVHRVGELIGMEVSGGDPQVRGRVLDVRLRPSPDRLELVHLLVGRGRPGTLLGYDRGDVDGPWLVKKGVLWLHRHTRSVAMDAVTRIDWDTCVLHVEAEAEGAPVLPD